MSVILVAEQDASYAERIVEVLCSAGWNAKAVASREAAFEAANSQRPGLLIASASLPEASSLLAAFSRNRGGPGSVVLVPVAVAGRVSAADYQADTLLDKPFSDQALTQIVRHCLDETQPAASEPAAPSKAAASQQLTSEDIFGEVLAEVEAEARRSRAIRRQRAARSSDDIERKLEETLSGVFPLAVRPKRSSRPGATTAPTPGAAPDTPPARKSPSRSGLPSGDEIDDLLDKTLSSLELPTRARKTSAKRTRRPAAQPPAPPPAAPPPAAPPPAEHINPPPPHQDQSPPGAAPQGAATEPPVAATFEPPPVLPPFTSPPAALPADALPVEDSKLSAPAPPTTWEGFEPPPELFPAALDESPPTPSAELPSLAPVPEPAPFEPEPPAFEPEPASFEPEPASIGAPVLGDAHASDLFPTSFGAAPAEELTPGTSVPETPAEGLAGVDDALSLGEEPLPDFFASSPADSPAGNPALEANSPTIGPPAIDIPPEFSPAEPLAVTAPSSALSDDLAFDLFPASFGETSPAPAAEPTALPTPGLGAEPPPELFPSSFAEGAPSPTREAPSNVSPPPELAAPAGPQDPPQNLPAATPPPSASLETQRMPAVTSHSFLDDDAPATDTAKTDTAKTATAKTEPFSTHRMVPLEDIATPLAKEGEAFGDYTLIDRVAVGGMAEVWRARRRGVEGFQKTVAIKRILSHLTDTPDFINMFIDEAKLAAQLSHNHIIQIYDLGKVGDDFFIAMEFVDGKDLRSILDSARKLGKALPIELALMIVAALARALDYAHRKKDFENRALGLVHRDVSPQNVLISYEGEIKLCDFGIVKAVAKASTTQMGALKGKLQYMSPEQAWGKSVDARSDIFSLGSVLFEVLTGERLFTGDSELSVLDAVRACRVKSPRDLVPEVPEEIDQIVRRALTGTPEERYQTAKELEQDIKAALDSLRLTPSQSDLATYMSQLFNPPMEFHNYEVPADAPTALSPEVPAPAREREGQPRPPSKADGEGRARKWLLIALLVGALAALTVIAFFVMGNRGGSSTEPAPSPPVVAAPGEDAPAEGGDQESDPTLESEGMPADPAEEGAAEAADPGSAGPEGTAPESTTPEGSAAEDSSTAGDASETKLRVPRKVEEASTEDGPASLDINRLVEERMAETQEDLQRKYEAQYEAESERLKRELEKTQRNLEDSPPPPPPEMNPNESDSEESDGP